MWKYKIDERTSSIQMPENSRVFFRYPGRIFQSFNSLFAFFFNFENHSFRLSDLPYQLQIKSCDSLRVKADTIWHSFDLIWFDSFKDRPMVMLVLHFHLVSLLFITRIEWLKIIMIQRVNSSDSEIFSLFFFSVSLHWISFNYFRIKELHTPKIRF